MADIESKVPDIGGHGDVPVIEILVAVGDTVKKDQGLVTLESDKATMEVPAIADGVVKALKVKLGDVVSEGALILEEGMAQRAGDIDLVWLNGYGWPAWTGGIMYWADSEGLGKIADGLKRHALPVAPLLQRLADTGAKFNV